MSGINQDSELYLIGFRIEPGIFDPQFYTIYVGDDKPLLWEGQPLFFPRPELASQALQKCGNGPDIVGRAPSELFLVYDLADALFVLKHGNIDESGNLLNLINLILDYCNNIDSNISVFNKNELEKTADHLTFDRDMTDLFKNDRNIKMSITNLIYWCIGMIFDKMRIIQ